MKTALWIAAVLALSSAACAREGATSRVPQLAFVAPAPPLDARPSPCAVAGPRWVVEEHPRILATTPLTPERMLPRPGGSFLAVWIEGTAETGYGVRGLALSPNGTPMGAPFSISEGDHAALGTLDATFVDHDRAVVSYYSSTERGFELVAMSVACETP